MGNLPNDPLGLLGHFTGDPAPEETFAELYAASQGRHSSRIDALKKVFPKLSQLVENTLLRKDL